MACAEIQKLKECLENGKNELKAEEERIDRLVKEEALSFFRRHGEGVKDPTLEEEFRISMKNIYADRIIMKRDMLENISRKISGIESEF